MDRALAPLQGRSTALQTLAWVALLVAVLALYARGVGSFQVGVYQDDATYLVLSDSIAFGDEYGMLNGPGPPLPSKYPFVFPLLLSPFARWPPAAAEEAVRKGETPGRSLVAATAVPLAATLINLSLLFWGWPLLSRISRWWGLGVACMYGLSPLVTGHARIVMSEPVFTTFVLAALLLTELCARDGSRAWTFLALGGAIAAAVFTRSIGMTIAAVAFLRLAAFAARTRRTRAVAASVREVARQLALVALGAVALVGLVVATTSVGLRHLPPKAYVDELLAEKVEPTMLPSPAVSVPRSVDSETFTARIRRVGRGYLLDQVRDVILPVGGGDRARNFARQLGVENAPAWLGAAVACVVAIGAWHSARFLLLSPAVLLFELVYFATILLWPWDAPRYLYPIQPFLQLQLLLGAARLGAVGRGRTTPAPVRHGASVAAVVCVGLVLGSAWKSLEVKDSRQFTRDLSVGADWLAGHAPPGAVVMARYPQTIYLYSGRSTVDLAIAPTPGDLERALARSSVDYVLVAPRLVWGSTASPVYSEVEDALLAALSEMSSRGQAELVYESAPRQKVVIYALRRAPEDGRS